MAVERGDTILAWKDRTSLTKHSGFVTQVTFVLYVIDDLTNEEIGKSHIRAYIPGYPLPIYKPGGWICFTNLGSGEYNVIIEGRPYQTQKVLVRVPGKDTGEKCPLVTVRMMPGPSYSLPDNVVCIYGKALAGSEILAMFQSKTQPVKLLYDYNDGRIIRLFSLDHKAMDGCCFNINAKEYFTVQQTLDETERVYLIDKELKGSYKKLSSKIYPVAKTTVNDNGEFFFAVRCTGKGEISCQMTMTGQEYAPVEIKIHPGERHCVCLVDSALKSAGKEDKS